MKKKIKNQIIYDQPIGCLKAVNDFLPPPDQLFRPEKRIKITISLDEESLRFFKKLAKKSGTKYQRMIRDVVRGYATHYS